MLDISQKHDKTFVKIKSIRGFDCVFAKNGDPTIQSKKKQNKGVFVSAVLVFATTSFDSFRPCVVFLLHRGKWRMNVLYAVVRIQRYPSVEIFLHGPRYIVLP